MVQRAGRPWGPLRGKAVEMNTVASLLREWLDEAALSVPQLHRSLTAEHFSASATGAEVIPDKRKLYDLLAGNGLTLEFSEAVVDVCGGDFPQVQERLSRVRELCRRGTRAPTPASADGGVYRELLVAKDRLIEAQDQLARLRQAQQDSDHARDRAQNIAIMMLALLGRLQSQVSSLVRERDALSRQGADAQLVAHTEELQRRLERSRASEAAAQETLAAALRDRSAAEQVAEQAARRVMDLEAELGQLRSHSGSSVPTCLVETDFVPMLPSVPRGEALQEAVLEDAEAALAKAQQLLAEGREAVADASIRVVEQAAPPIDEALRSQDGPADTRVAPKASGGLSGTTPDNPPELEISLLFMDASPRRDEKLRQVAAQWTPAQVAELFLGERLLGEGTAASFETLLDVVASVYKPEQVLELHHLLCETSRELVGTELLPRAVASGWSPESIRLVACQLRAEDPALSACLEAAAALPPDRVRPLLTLLSGPRRFAVLRGIAHSAQEKYLAEYWQDPAWRSIQRLIASEVTPKRAAAALTASGTRGLAHMIGQLRPIPQIIEICKLLPSKDGILLTEVIGSGLRAADRAGQGARLRDGLLARGVDWRRCLLRTASSYPSFPMHGSSEAYIPGMGYRQPTP
ncbi:hypothetical protein [Streptomyces melanogenes]|uniref:hypothetical protein n=1 Tax=Streptomyces melanogenes TaxID=67326 RepID=UPI00378F5C75